MKTGIKSIHAAFNLIRRISNFELKMRNSWFCLLWLKKLRSLYMYKAVLQNDLLQDPDEGVNYFKNTLKQYFLKGATNVYLYASPVNLLLSRGPLLGASTVVMVTQSSTSSSYLNQLTFPSLAAAWWSSINLMFPPYSLDFWPYLNRLP